jgi:hypothetical protein
MLTFSLQDMFIPSFSPDYVKQSNGVTVSFKNNSNLLEKQNFESLLQFTIRDGYWPKS